MPEQLSRPRRVGIWTSRVLAVLLASMFLVPLGLPSDSVPPLSGRANAIDYAASEGRWGWGNQNHNHGSFGHNQLDHGTFVYTDLGPYAALIYLLADINCHQKAERSWEIRGNQMPVCVRDIGILAGALLMSVIFTFRGRNRWLVRDTALSVLPDRWLEPIYRTNMRTKVCLGLAALAILPIGFDGGIQMLTSYESTNSLRLLTGAFFGAGICLYFLAGMSARPSEHGHDPSMVDLPAGLSFRRPLSGHQEE
ncbi:MAG: hypothetical protein CMB77_08050 [Euryarchaeota archaeon]|nr:hypothetical protein [Euryarchaeota archaeon]